MFKQGIVLTGGIATGKSTTASLMKLLGFRVIDADKIAHEVLESSQSEIKSCFGEEFIKDGKVDRKALGALVFSNKDKRLELERIVHPKIKERIISEAIEQERFNKPYLVDIPLFFEREGVYDFSKVIVVYTPPEIQLERLIKRDGLSKEEALKRIEAQLPIEKKRKRATFLIDNSKDLAHLQKECLRVKEEILNASN
ncbi:MAG: dephospho-CoA kinase [Epsilonproteobacteria bacterium]|nr:dephospho-CoA kinase [Campylobacterota bacterium]